MLVKRSISKDGKFDNLTVELEVPNGTTAQIEAISLEIELAIRNALRMPIPQGSAPAPAVAPVNVTVAAPPIPANPPTIQQRIEAAKSQEELFALWKYLDGPQRIAHGPAMNARHAQLGGV